MSLTVLLLGMPLHGAAAQTVTAGAGQEPGSPSDSLMVDVRIEQIAGATIYLNIGTDAGLAVGDTLSIHPEGGGARLGFVAVRLANPRRAVLDFVGEPFALDRGQTVRIALRRAPPVPVAVAEAPAPQPAAPTPALSTIRRPAAVSGRWGLDMDVSHSSTELAGGVGSVSASRTFATPAFRLDLSAPEAVAGFDLQLRTRTTYRYGTPEGFQSEVAPRFYEVSLRRRFVSVPLELSLGRFHSPGESFSGYWDGVAARYGGSGLGIGAMVGLQPDRWNQLPNSELPKASVFVDFERRAGDLRWRGDVSTHVVWPTTRDVGTHVFFGAGHRLSRRGFRLTQHVQVDRDAFNGGLRLTRFTTQTTVPLSPGLDLRAGVSRRQTYILWDDDPAELFAPQRDRANVGISARSGGRSASLDVAVNRDVSGNTTRSASGLLAQNRLLGDVDVTTSFAWWDGDTGSSWSVAPALRWSWKNINARTGYRFYSATITRRTQTTHSPDLNLDLRLSNGLRASLRVLGRFGAGVMSEYVQLSLSRMF